MSPWMSPQNAPRLDINFREKLANTHVAELKKSSFNTENVSSLENSNKNLDI
jgi:hypothetical protein